MLQKAQELPVTVGQPFANDRLNRQPVATKLTELIASITQPFVLAINGRFGTGKTTFIRMWRDDLRMRGYHSVYLSAWESDFTADPLVALTGEIEAAIKREAKGDLAAPIATKLEQLKEIGAKVARKTLPFAAKVIIKKATGAAPAELKELFDGTTEDLAEFAEEIARERIEHYEADKATITKFRETLQSLAEDVTKGPNTEGPLLVFVDELDRCRPTYAIELLERVKHVFSVPGVVFILSIDRRQLGHVIRSQYGSGADAEGYLRRFIDLNFRLPNPRPALFARYLADHFGLAQALQARSEGPSEQQIIVETFGRVAEAFDLSLREQEQCFTELNVVLRTSAGAFLSLQLLAFLPLLRAAESEMYERYIAGSVSAREVIDRLRNTEAGKVLLSESRGLHLEAILICFSGAPEEYAQAFQGAQTTLANKMGDMASLNRARVLVGVAQHYGGNRELLKDHALRLSFAESFRS